MTIADAGTGRGIIVAVVIVGVVASAVAAVVPHYSNHYRLDAGVLAACLLPYLLYGIFGWLAPRSGLLHLVGGLNLADHLWLVTTRRLMDFDGYASGAIYYAPLIFAVLIVVAGIMGMHREGTRLAPQ
ncbi:MAG: hypothetical protein U5S82_17740 [Gammaproteobacteria bacterium]|nr:hypothetical protein [Gammaproteobacteria bacterium]